MTDDESRAMHNNVEAQTKDPDRRLRDKHIKLSYIWQCTQLINKIQEELVLGYSFDKDKLAEMVNAMFGFINGIVGPDQQAHGVDEVKVEEVNV